MHLSLSHDMLAITIQEDSKTFYYLQNIADKNFQKKLIDVATSMKAGSVWNPGNVVGPMITNKK